MGIKGLPLKLFKNITVFDFCYSHPFFFLFFRFFVDIRLYNKARSAIEPFAFSRFREEKIRQQIEASRPARLKIKSNLPAVNQELALKFLDEDDKNNRKKAGNLLKDDRFTALFNNPDFEVDKNADEYKMLTPVLSRLEKSKVKQLKKKIETTMAFEEENEAAKSSDDDLFSEKDENEEMQSSDDDDRIWEKDLKRNYRQIRKEQKRRPADGEDGDDDDDDDKNNDIGSDDENVPGVNVKHSNSAPALEFKVKNITNKLSR